MNVRALELPFMDAAVADHLGLIATRLKRGRFDLGGGTWRFSLAPVSGQPVWPHDPFVVVMEWGGGRLHLVAGRATLALLYAHQFPQAPLDVLPEDLALAGFRLAWRDLMARLEQLGGRRVRLVHTGRAKIGTIDGAPFRFALSLDSESAGDGVEGLIAADAPGLALLALLARRRPPEVGAIDPDLPVTLRMELGDVTLPMAALRSLGRQDVLRPDNIIDPQTPTLWLRADSCHAARGRLQGQSLVIESILENNPPMSKPKTSGPAEDLPALANLDELEVRVSFDLGEMTLRMGELAALQPGQVLTLDVSPPRLVSIRANGRLVGRGELVRVGEEVGVRVLEMASLPSPAAPASDEDAS
jgi:type III secretion protein Q